MPILQRISRDCYEMCMTRVLLECKTDEGYMLFLSRTAKLPKLEKFNNGSYSHIYLSGNTVHKVIKFPHSNDERMIREKVRNNRLFFQQEQQVHEHVVKHDKGLTCMIKPALVVGPLMIIRLEYLKGYITLAEFRKFERGKVYETTADVICHRLDALMACLHRLDVFHGDIKANNIMVRLEEDGSVGDLRVIDFGKAWLGETIRQRAAVCFKAYQSCTTWQKRWRLANNRRMRFFQNLYYSSILQYVFSEYKHRSYARLYQMIDAHSVGLLMIHLYFEHYINDFDQAATVEGRREQFVAQFIKLFGASLLVSLFRLATAHAEHDCDTLVGAAVHGLSDSYSSESESGFRYLQNLGQDVGQISVPHDLSQFIRIDGTAFMVTATIEKQLYQARREGQPYTIEQHLEKVSNQNVRTTIARLLGYDGLERILRDEAPGP